MPWCMPGSLTRGFLWNRWRAKRSRHSRRMRNPQFYVSGKRPMLCCQVVWCPVTFNPLTLGVKATTSNLMVLGESGQMPPSVFSHINVICYLKRLHHLPSWMIVKQMYIELCRLHECGFVTWVTKAQEVMQYYGIELGEQCITVFKQYCKQIVKDKFVNYWTSEIQNSSKNLVIRYYSSHKTVFCMEQ